MKLQNIHEVEDFRKVIHQCKDDVFLKSQEGDVFNLKSAMSISRSADCSASRATAWSCLQATTKTRVCCCPSSQSSTRKTKLPNKSVSLFPGCVQTAQSGFSSSCRKRPG